MPRRRKGTRHWNSGWGMYPSEWSGKRQAKRDEKTLILAFKVFVVVPWCLIFAAVCFALWLLLLLLRGLASMIGRLATMIRGRND